MVAPASNRPPNDAVVFRVSCGGRQQSMTYQQLFAAGHRFWVRKDYANAAVVFRRLTAVTNRGPRAGIMLAHCEAMAGDYAACSTCLHETLAETPFHAAISGLHDAFVFWSVGLFVDAKEALERVASEHAELPTPCLLLATLMAESGNPRRSRQFLQDCVDRDRPGGAVARIARRQLDAVD